MIATMAVPDSPSAPATSGSPLWTMAAFRQGVIEVVPFLPGLAAFGMAYGTVAARKGFTFFEALLMSGTVFAGLVQMIVLESWPEAFTAGAIVGIAALTALLNARYIMIGATMRPLLGVAPASKAYPALFFLVEPAWIVSLRYYGKGGRDPAYFLGAGIALYINWIIATAPGYLAGASVGDPQRFGLDLVMPAYFVAMLVPMWRGVRRSWGIIVGAAVALVTEYVFGGFWYVLAGAIAGSIAGAFNDD